MYLCPNALRNGNVTTRLRHAHKLATKNSFPPPPQHPNKRVVVTGVGLVTPLGCNVAEVWTNLLQGKSGVRTTQAYHDSLPCKIAAEGKFRSLYRKFSQHKLVLTGQIFPNKRNRDSANRNFLFSSPTPSQQLNKLSKTQDGMEIGKQPAWQSETVSPVHKILSKRPKR